MRRLRPCILMTLVALAAAALPPAALAEEAASSPLITDYLRQVDHLQQQIAALAAAMPQETYEWRPAEGVRSVGEVYLHIAFGNYLLLQVVGQSPPAELADQVDVAKIQAWDTSTTDKDAIAQQVADSFEHFRATVAGFSEADLEPTVEFFGQTMTKRQMLLLALGHLHEHLGQEIAYARMNGVVPPWSAAQQQAEEESNGS